VAGGQVAGVEVVRTHGVLARRAVELVHIDNRHPLLQLGEHLLQGLVGGDDHHAIEKHPWELLDGAGGHEHADVAARERERQVGSQRGGVTLDTVGVARLGEDRDLGERTDTWGLRLSSVAARRTRSRVSSLTLSRLLSTRLTVPAETPATRARS
jgi:hypothetical protein